MFERLLDSTALAIDGKKFIRWSRSNQVLLFLSQASLREVNSRLGMGSYMCVTVIRALEM